jgi:hypothetical protein
VPHRVRRGTDLGEQPDQVVAAGEGGRALFGRPGCGRRVPRMQCFVALRLVLLRRTTKYAYATRAS